MQASAWRQRLALPAARSTSIPIRVSESSGRCASCSTSLRTYTGDGRDRFAPPELREPDLPRDRAGPPGTHGRSGSPRSCAPPRAPVPRGRVRAHAARPAVDGMIFVSCEMTNLSGQHDHYGRLVADGRAHRVRQRRAEPAGHPLRRRGRACGRKLATQHLVDLGHTRIAFAGARALPPGAGKGSRLARAARRPGIVSDGLIEHDEFTVEGGGARRDGLLARPTRPPGSSAPTT